MKLPSIPKLSLGSIHKTSHQRLTKLQRLPKHVPSTTMNLRRILMKVPWIRILIPLVALAVLGAVIFQVPPPSSLPTASVNQLIFFFGPLLIFLTFLINIGVRFLIRSFFLAASMVTLLTLRSIDQLSLVSFLGVVLVTVFLWKVCKKSNSPKIPNRIPRVSQLQKQR